ncbi:OsmC family protein [Anaerococcus sp. Marseille-P3625]|uniref:OsmC family protein n=1 Tax=Anaerococcus sp. Marseille-P3625 TaxID=1977277 RepID=UPI000C083351|nr:OsmC family protein [Anaerococcus sp. Marseille-P3625]
MTDDINFFNKNYRAVVRDDLVKIYNEKSSIAVDSPISFDSEKEEFTSIDYLISAITSEIILTMKRQAEKHQQVLQDIEAKVNLTIKNPMYLLNVIGFDEKALIDEINIDIYFFSFLEGDDLCEFLQEVLDKTLIYNTFKDKIKVNFKIVL